MALQVEDILARRSRMLFVDAAAAVSSARKVAEWMALELNHDEAWINQQVASFQELAKTYLP